MAANQRLLLRKCPEREQWAGYRRRGFAGRTERGDFSLFQLYDLWIDLDNEPIKRITVIFLCSELASFDIKKF